MSERSKFSAEVWTNEIGQTLSPGDAVVAVGTGYAHEVIVRRGIYEGVNKKRLIVKSKVKGWRYDEVTLEEAVTSVRIRYQERFWPRDGWRRAAYPLKRVYKLG